MDARGSVWGLVIAGLLASSVSGCFPEYSFAPEGTGGVGGTGGTGGGTGGGASLEGMILIEPPETPWPIHLAASNSEVTQEGTVRFSSAFYVDSMEVTTGRFRAWLEQRQGEPPCDDCELDPGGPYESEMIWNADWNQQLEDPTHYAGCYLPIDNFGPSTWELAQSDEQWELPMTCVKWFDAVAFCASEGKRLLTQAEWVYVATDGNSDQVFPWGDEPYEDCSHSVHRDGEDSFCGFPVDVGTAVNDRTQEGVRDLAGSVFEWVWDVPGSGPLDDVLDYAGPPFAPGNTRVRHGGSFIVQPGPADRRMENQIFDPTYGPDENFADTGFRCALTQP